MTLALTSVVFFCAQYGTETLAEDAALGRTVLTISATDADDADSGSSQIEFHISSGNEDEVFRVETDGKGVGHVVIAKVKHTRRSEPQSFAVTSVHFLSSPPAASGL